MQIRILHYLALLTAVFCYNVALADSPLKFSQNSHNFGDVPEQGGIVSCTFQATNTAQNPIVILSASAFCGCTKVEYSRQPLQPNETSSITVNFNPLGQPGLLQRTVVVRTSEGTSEFRIEGNVIPKPKTKEEEFPLEMGGGLRMDRNHHHFGYVEHGQTVSTAFNIFNSTQRPLTLNIIPSEESGLLSVNYPQTIAPGEEGAISLTYQIKEQSRRYGSVKDVLSIDISGRRSRYPLSCTAIAIDKREQSETIEHPALTLSENFIKFGTVSTSQTVLKKSLRISNSSQREIHIRKFECDASMLRVWPSTATLQPGKSIDLRVEMVVAKDRFGAVMDKLKMYTSDPVKPMYTVRVTAIREN